MTSAAVALAAVLGATLITTGSASAAPESDRPAVGDCTNAPRLDNWILTSGTVDCATSHTGQTVHVGRWRSTVSPTQANALDAKGEQRLMRQMQPEFDACNKKLNALLGGVVGAHATKASAFFGNITGPDKAQWARGERWVRCDIVAGKAPTKAKGNESVLQPIPAPAKLKGFLNSPATSWAPYNYCVGENPKDQLYYWIACDKTPILGIAWANPSGKYPGSEDAAFAQMRKQCLSVIRRVVSPYVPDFAIWVIDFTPEALTKDNYSTSTWFCGLDVTR